MIEDMGGHGRALEILIDVLSHYEYPNLTQPLSEIYNQVFYSLKDRYPDINGIATEDNLVETTLLAALFGTTMTQPNVLRFEQAVSRHGLCRIVANPNGGYRISIPYIWIKLLSSYSSNELLQRFLLRSEMDDPNSNSPNWQDWETFNMNILALKSFVFARLGEPVNVQTLHSGAKWGNGTMTDVINVSELQVQMATRQISTSTFNISDSVQCEHGIVIPSNGSNIILNAPGASAADSFCCRNVSIGGSILELHQYKLQKAILNQDDFEAERVKAVPTTTSTTNPALFLLITSSSIREPMVLPPNCGLVDRSCYEDFFGPYAARAFIHNKVYANIASFQSLVLVPRIGEVRATAIQDHRPFTGATDCHNRAGIPLDVAESLCFESW